MTNRLFLSPPHQNGRERALIDEVLDSNYLAPVGPMLDRLEQKMREITGTPHCLAVNSGTAALHLALRHLCDKLPGNDPRPPVVIASSLSFIASVSPALQLGCEVWLTDVEASSWTMDPIQLSHALSEARAENRQVLCVLPTDLYGQACDLEAITGLCKPGNIPVLCDSAEALGVVRDGPAPWAEIYSFNGNKIITSSGGGILASHDAELITHALKLSTQAKEPVAHYEHQELGYNYRMSNLLAGIAVAQLETLSDRVQKKREIFNQYKNILGSMDGLSFMPEAGWNQSTRWLSVLLVHADRFGVTPRDIRFALEKENIESRPIWKPLHQQPVLRQLRMYGGDIADQLYREGLCLPSGTAMTEADVERVCTIIKQTR